MSLVIILYLAVLCMFSFAYIYKGIRLFRNDSSDAELKRIRMTLKALENDEVEYTKFRKFDAVISTAAGVLCLMLLPVTFLLISDLTQVLSVREIHLIRTCIIAVLFLSYSRNMLLYAVRDKFVKRISDEENQKYDLKTAIIFLVLSTALIYSIYIQITYAW